jgi:hypothetical protein
MTEDTPLNLEEMRRLNRDLMEKVLDKAASDEQWKQRLLDDPDAAMREADFSEVRQLHQIQASLPQEEVRGHGVGMRLLPGCIDDPDTWVPHTV